MAFTTAKDLLSAPVPVSMRFDAPLLEQLKDSARRSFRSVNAEVNFRLKASFERGLDQALRAQSSKAAAEAIIA
jgi:hypothetical protein